jgi:hypothetical protein
MKKIDFFILFLSYLTFIYLIFFTQFITIIKLLINYLFFGNNLIFNITFLLTLFYQVLVQYISRGRYLFSSIVLSIFLLSILIPLFYSLLYVSDIVKLGEYLSYPILANTIITPLIITLFYFKLEKGYLNPLRPIMFFITCYITIGLSIAAYDYQIDKEINKLGLSELLIIINSIPIFSGIFSQSNIPESSLEALRGLIIYIPLPLIILFIISAFAYLLISLLRNIQYYSSHQFFLKNVLSNANFKYYLSNITKIVFASIVTVLIILIINYSLIIFDYRFLLLLLLIPYLLIVITLLLVR